MRYSRFQKSGKKKRTSFFKINKENRSHTNFIDLDDLQAGGRNILKKSDCSKSIASSWHASISGKGEKAVGDVVKSINQVVEKIPSKTFTHWRRAGKDTNIEKKNEGIKGL